MEAIQIHICACEYLAEKSTELSSLREICAQRGVFDGNFKNMTQLDFIGDTFNRPLFSD